MKKQEFIKEVALKTWLTQDVAKKTLSTMIDLIIGELNKGNQVTITGFWTFGISTRKARIRRNPKTGEKIKVAESNTPKFKTGAAFKAAIK